MGGSEEQGAGVCSVVPSDRTRGSEHVKVNLNIRKCFFHHARGDLTNLSKYLMGGSEEQGAGVCSVVPSDRTRGSGHMKANLNIRKCFFHHEEGQTLAQVAQRGCRV